MPASCAAPSAASTGSRELHGARRLDGCLVADDVAQGLAGHELHDEVESAVVVTLVEDRDDVRVRELRG